MLFLRLLTQRGLTVTLLVIILAACGNTTAERPTAGVPTVAPTTQTGGQTPPTAVPAPTSAGTASQPTAAPNGPQRIAFAAGATSGAVEGAVVNGTRVPYVLWAAAGQTMNVKISALESNAVFSLANPNGQIVAGTEEGQDATIWNGTLAQTGDYAITVGPTRGNATYRLEVSVVSPPPTGGDPSLRKADWNAVLTNDSGLIVKTVEDKLYVTVAANNAQVGGIPLLDTIVYGDFDSDGAEEAAISLASGGTAGNIGFLVYRQGIPAPKLVAWHDGYKQGLELVNGQLVSRDALYAGWEPNCCPSGFRYVTYALQGSSLQVTNDRSEPIPGTHVLAVKRFYDLLAQRDFTNAYAMLSVTYQQANPYDAWVAGYANTQSVTAEVTPDAANPNVAHITLTSTASGADGGQITQRFAGTWTLQWESTRPGWSLDEAQIQQLP